MKMMFGVLLLSLLTAAPAAAKHWHDEGKHWNKHWKGHDDDDRDVNHRAATCYFQPHDVRIIREYYEPRYRSLPPGLAKKFARTGHLPRLAKENGTASRRSRARTSGAAIRLSARIHRRNHRRVLAAHTDHDRCGSSIPEMTRDQQFRRVFKRSRSFLRVQRKMTVVTRLRHLDDWLPLTRGWQVERARRRDRTGLPVVIVG
jgi:hypothetical protein